MQYVSEHSKQPTNRLSTFNNSPCAASASFDFDEEAEAHVVLFSRLMHYIRGESDSVTGEFDEHQQPCELGRWLQAEGAECFGKLQAFCHLRDIHLQFHRDAEAVFAHLHAGSWMAAEQACKRELSLSLRRVLVALTEMNQMVHQQNVKIVN